MESLGGGAVGGNSMAGVGGSDHHVEMPPRHRLHPPSARSDREISHRGHGSDSRHVRENQGRTGGRAVSLVAPSLGDGPRARRPANARASRQAGGGRAPTAPHLAGHAVYFRDRGGRCGGNRARPFLWLAAFAPLRISIAHPCQTDRYARAGVGVADDSFPCRCEFPPYRSQLWQQAGFGVGQDSHALLVGRSGRFAHVTGLLQGVWLGKYHAAERLAA